MSRSSLKVTELYCSEDDRWCIYWQSDYFWLDSLENDRWCICDKNTIEPQPGTDSNNLGISLSEPVEIPLIRSQQIGRPELSDDYAYLRQGDFNIGQSNDPNSFNEAVSYS